MELGNCKKGPTPFPEAQTYVLMGGASGMTDKEIARERGISVDGVNNIWRRLRTKWDKPKRAALVAEAIARGIIVYCAMVLVFISGTLSIINDSFDQPRTNSRLSRGTMSRNFRLRNRAGSRSTRNDGLTIDFDLENISEESLLALMEATAEEPNTLAPWSSVAGTRQILSQQDLVEGSSSNELRLQLWRLKKQEIEIAQQTEVLAEPYLAEVKQVA